MRCNLTTAKAVGGGSGNLPPALLFLLGFIDQTYVKCTFLLPQEVAKNHSMYSGGAKKSTSKAAVSIGFYNANPKPAKQVLSKLDAEMRFETPPRIFRAWRGVISDLCFRHGFLSIFQKMTSRKKRAQNSSHSDAKFRGPRKCASGSCQDANLRISRVFHF
jgi:hypothetical protein